MANTPVRKGSSGERRYVALPRRIARAQTGYTPPA